MLLREGGQDIRCRFVFIKSVLSAIIVYRLQSSFAGLCIETRVRIEQNWGQEKAYEY